MSTFVRVTTVALVAALLGSGCGDDPPPPTQNSAKAPAKAAPKNNARRGAKANSAPAVPSNLPPLPTREFLPRDFDESELSRDPFRSFEEMFKAQAKNRVVVQREVLAPKFSLDQLRLVGLVSGGTGRAVMNDPTGFGWLVKIGDFVGKPEMVRAGGPSGSEVAVNWRLDRIRPNDAVFIREDPTRPDVPSTTRVVTLRNESELSLEVRTGVRAIPSPTAPALTPDGLPARPPELPAPPPPAPGATG